MLKRERSDPPRANGARTRSKAPAVDAGRPGLREPVARVAFSATQKAEPSTRRPGDASEEDSESWRTHSPAPVPSGLRLKETPSVVLP